MLQCLLETLPLSFCLCRDKTFKIVSPVPSNPIVVGWLIGVFLNTGGNSLYTESKSLSRDAINFDWSLSFLTKLSQKLGHEVQGMETDTPHPPKIRGPKFYLLKK